VTIVDRVERLGKLLGKEREQLDRLGKFCGETACTKHASSAAGWPSHMATYPSNRATVAMLLQERKPLKIKTIRPRIRVTGPHGHMPTLRTPDRHAKPDNEQGAHALIVLSALANSSGMSVSVLIALPLVPKLCLGTHHHKTPFCVCSATNRYPSARETEFHTKRSQTEFGNERNRVWEREE
jgi:hypothetical protein